MANQYHTIIHKLNAIISSDDPFSSELYCEDLFGRTHIILIIRNVLSEMLMVVFCVTYHFYSQHKHICPSCLVDNRKTVPLYCNINVQAKLFTITSTERDDDYSILVEWTLLPGRTVLSVT
jgi:hypothetical protein